jgi:restriction system protein
MWEKRITHRGLNAFRVVKGQTEYDVEMKAAAQEATWAAMWQRRQDAEAKRNAQTRRLAAIQLSKFQIEEARAHAAERTRELEAERMQLDNLLRNALKKPPLLNWNNLKDRSKFPTPRPTLTTPTPLPKAPFPAHPSFTAQVITPSLSFLDKLIPSRRAEKISLANQENERLKKAASDRFQDAMNAWEAACTKIKHANADTEKRDARLLSSWMADRDAFIKNQEAQHQRIDQTRKLYDERDKDAIEFHAEELLNQSQYPAGFPQERTLEYQPEAKVLVIDFELPNLAALPRTKDVKYVATRSEFQETPVSDIWLRKTYDEVLYQMALRTLHEIFCADEADAFVSVVFNGWVRSIDKSTGAETHACIMSLEARKDEFLAINLEHVEPKACFKKLKGVSASKLAELSPVKPLVRLNREDKRFVDGYAVADLLDERTNLAAMDWMDFENLIREVFEKEFSKGGGEVKITQASRDGGVDAIAFDPDPIRGGKTVIQAKRIHQHSWCIRSPRSIRNRS